MQLEENRGRIKFKFSWDVVVKQRNRVNSNVIIFIIIQGEVSRQRNNVYKFVRL